jgi:hypothetical protein
MLALQVDHIDHPPLDSAPARVGLVDVESGIFNAHDETTGWNFPQGARQIWCADGKTYAYNCPAGPVPRCRIRGESGELKRELPWGVAAVSPAANCLFSIDFGRVHRAGGYGHSEVLPWKNHEATRNASGLMRVDIDSGIVRTTE